jgi:tetratricopeptide (TPR) repeat protein
MEREAIEYEARALIDRRRYSQARACISKGLVLSPGDVDLQYLDAFIDYCEDKHEAALLGVVRALAGNAEHYGARTLHGLVLAETGKLAEAEAVWIALLRSYPEDPDCYEHYAELMLKTLNADKAFRLAQEGLRLDPSHAGCLYVAALVDLIRGGDTAGACAHLATLLREHPERVSSSLALVVSLSERGDNRGALRVAQELLRHQPDSGHVLELVRQLKMHTHWSMIPLYPMQRWGWAGAIGVTVLGIAAVRASATVLPPALSISISVVWFVYILYSWCWPPLFKRLI